MNLFIRAVDGGATADLRAVAALSGLSLGAVLSALLAESFGRTPSPHWPAISHAMTAVRRTNKGAEI